MNDATSHRKDVTFSSGPARPIPTGGSDLWGHRQPGDGAAPLIGSSAVMRALRSRIERIAATDFTVLIEGGSGRELEL